MMPSMAADEVALLEELGANATAAATVQLLGDWVLRASPDLPFRRSNSVLVRGPDAPTELDERLAVAEDFGRRHGIPLRLQLSPDLFPVLDAAVAARGLVREAPVTVMTASTASVLERLPPTSLTCRLSTEIEAGWVEAYAAAYEDPEPGRRTAAYGRSLRTLGPPAVTGRVDVDGAPAGVGFAVAERGWTGVFGMATTPALHRRGVATAVLRALAGWAGAQHCPELYLQVEDGNDGAIALYERAGFRPHHGYHYRTGEGREQPRL
jgi:GNAT superfamily N-acetyltransferase